MINVKDCEIKLSPVAIYESLCTRNNSTGSCIDYANWNDFAKYIGIAIIDEHLPKTKALEIINNYLNENKITAQEKICSFFNWLNQDDLQKYITISDELLKEVSKNTKLIKNYAEKDLISQNIKIKKAELFNKQFILATYNRQGILNSIHISIINSMHKTKSGKPADYSEIAYYPEYIALNADTYKDFDDNNGYNDYYEFYIKSKNYNFNEYKNLSEQIFFFNH